MLLQTNMFYLFCFRVNQISIRLLYKCISWVVLLIKNPPANEGDIRNAVDPRVGKIPWRRA